MKWQYEAVQGVLGTLLIVKISSFEGVAKDIVSLSFKVMHGTSRDPFPPHLQPRTPIFPSTQYMFLPSFIVCASRNRLYHALHP